VQRRAARLGAYSSLGDVRSREFTTPSVGLFCDGLYRVKVLIFCEGLL